MFTKAQVLSDVGSDVGSDVTALVPAPRLEAVPAPEAAPLAVRRAARGRRARQPILLASSLSFAAGVLTSAAAFFLQG